ncbi:MAG: DUF4013 domain-containing protein [Chloroflexi bacterium]|nr:DUF4013 domain-containing protein [Chloroflexota bacterium]
MDYGKAITFVFEDEEWISKVLIGGLIFFLTMLLAWTFIGALAGGALITGYMLELLRNVRRGDERPLPAWDEWGEKMTDGFKLFVIFLIWSLPMVVVALPVGLVIGLMADSDASAVASLLLFCFSCLTFIYAIAVALAAPAITIKYAESGEISAGFQFGEIAAFTREHLLEVIVILIVMLFVQLVAGFVGMLLCGVGMLFTAFYSILVQGHLYGQLGRELDSAPTSPLSIIT